jgi:H+-transporting ATPase
MIEIAVILSGVVRHWPDFFIILLLLVANAVVGFWEEREAGNAIARIFHEAFLGGSTLKAG